MTLDEYLKERTQTDLARRLKVTQGLVGHWVSGRVKISAERALDIENATDGAVTRNELRPDIFGSEAPRAPAPSDEPTPGLERQAGERPAGEAA